MKEWLLPFKSMQSRSGMFESPRRAGFKALDAVLNDLDIE